MTAVETVTLQIHHYDKKIAQIARSEYPETARLQQVNGVGDLIALSYVLTLDDPQRFHRSRDVGGFLGLRPKRRDSGESRPQLRITKEGDSYQGKGASKSGREFARKSFWDAATLYLEERKPHVSERTIQFEKERLKPLCKHFGESPLLRFKPEDVAAYQTARLAAGISGRTVNMETGVLRRMLKRAKVWNTISEDVKALPERQGAVGKVLPADLKRKLFEVAASRPEWAAAHCAAVLAVSTTCRGVEIRNLRWQDVDLFSRVAAIRRSKTASGHRTIPLNGDAMAALTRLLERARALGSSEPGHYVFPTCENLTIDPKRPQKSWRTAWRKLVRETARQVGRVAAWGALGSTHSLRAAIAAWKQAAGPVQGLRFHDLRHQAITEMAETGASDGTLMALAGHMSRRMLEHYSHVRMAAKRTALDKLESGLMGSPAVKIQPAFGKAN